MNRQFFDYYVDQSNSSSIVCRLIKIDTFLTDIEDFIDNQGRSIVCDLENVGQAAAQRVGLLFEVS